MITEEQFSVLAVTFAVFIPISYCYFLFKRKYRTSQPQLQTITPTTLPPTPTGSATTSQLLTPQDHAELRREHLSLVAQSMESKQREVDMYFMVREMRDSQARAEEAQRQMDELNARLLTERLNRNPWLTPTPLNGGLPVYSEQQNVQGRRRRGPLR